MRFDLSNQVSNGSVDWAVRFYFGPSKDVRQIELDGSVTRELRKVDEIAAIFSSFQGVLTRAAASLHTTSPESLQKVWTRRGDGMSPYDLTDKLAELAEQFHATLVDEIAEEERSSVGRYVVEVARGDAANNKVAGHAKLERNAMRILAGIVIGDWFNTLPWHDECMAAA
jgi:DNA (cytosine-5)-methyltransferase 1